MNNWQKEFDELSFDGNSLCMVLITGLERLGKAERAENQIKSFISQLLKEQEEKGYEKGKADWKRIGDGREKHLLSQAQRMIERLEKEFEFDSFAHSRGGCSFSSMSLCSAEEHRIKQKVGQIIKSESNL